MTRIRKNWSSSRGSQDPGDLKIDCDYQRVDTRGKESSPTLLQLVNEDAMQMLAAVSLESLEHDSDICNLEQEGTLAEVLGPMQINKFENEAHRMESKQVIWQRMFAQGGDSRNNHSKSGPWFKKLSSIWRSDCGPVAVMKPSIAKTMDEERTKSPSVAEDEVVDAELSVRMERSKQNLTVNESEQGMLSEAVYFRCLERGKISEEASKVLQEFVTGGAAKKRLKPWESQSEAVVAAKKTDQNSAYGAGCVAIDSKRRMTAIHAPQIQRTRHENETFAEFEKAVNGDVDRDRLYGKSEKTVSDDADGHVPCRRSEKVLSGVGSRILRRGLPKKLGQDGGHTGRLKLTEIGDGNGHQMIEASEKSGNRVDRRRQWNVQLDDRGGDAEDRKRPSARTQIVEIHGDKRKLRSEQVKPEIAVQSAVAGNVFPTGWKYKGLAQIAEKDEDTDGQVKKLCGRTDGHNWRCPLRVVEGLSLCQHHLNKARAKKLSKSNPDRKRFQDVKPDGVRIAPCTSDSLALKTPSHCDHLLPVKFRRRPKTAKLSVL